ncbi:MAG: replication protein [Deltaproteobacteria bacterium]|nr:replication protein [Deltaproteobacteria bacterium]
MADVQIAHGYTRIANELMEAFCRINLSSYESRIVWFVIRKTYGFNRKMDRISLRQFSQGTGIRHQHARRAIKSLVDKHILTTHPESPQRILYGIQKNHEKWMHITRQPLPIQGVPLQGDPMEGVPTQDATSPYIGSKPLPIQGDTKERKTNKDNRVRHKPSPANGDFRIKDLFAWWDQEFKSRFGEPYNFSGGKEGKLLKGILQKYQPDTVKDLAMSFFNSKDTWVRENGGFTIGVFCSQINKLVSTSRGTQRQAQPKEKPNADLTYD